MGEGICLVLDFGKLGEDFVLGVWLVPFAN